MVARIIGPFWAIHLPQVGTALAEHRSLTVLCAECVDVARLADHVDAEELHAVVQVSHTTCMEVIHRFERLKDLAAPGMVVLSASTARLVEGYFLWQEKAVPPLPGDDQGRVAYDVLGESEARSRLDIVVKQRRLTPFVGREAEMAILRERWEQVQEGMDQVVLLHGESGIGKSRLVQMLTEQVAGEPHIHFECRCSPYHQHSARYPVTELELLSLLIDQGPTTRILTCVMCRPEFQSP